MGKRLTDTELHDRAWYMILPCRLKCAVRYLFDKCDNIGVWEPNYVLAAAYVGESFTEEELLDIDGGQQFEKLPSGKIFLPDFCDFQYGTLTNECRPHRPVIAKLKKTGLFDRVLIGYRKGINTLEDKDKEKDQEKDQGGAGEKQKPDPLPEMTASDFNLFQSQLIQDAIFIEQLMASRKIPDHTVMMGWIKAFSVHISGEGKLRKDFADYKRHFKNWIVKQDMSAPPVDTRPSVGGETASERKGRELLDEILGK